MLRVTTYLLAVSMLLVGCATAPWPQEAIRNAIVVPEVREQVWARVIRTTAGNNLSITGADKVNGIVSAERSIAPRDESGNIHGNWAVCGGVGLLNRPLSQHVDLKILVLPHSQGTNVTINARFSETRQDKRTRETQLVSCTSTGVLEAALLDRYWSIPASHLTAN